MLGTSVISLILTRVTRGQSEYFQFLQTNFYFYFLVAKSVGPSFSGHKVKTHKLFTKRRLKRPVQWNFDLIEKIQDWCSNSDGGGWMMLMDLILSMGCIFLFQNFLTYLKAFGKVLDLFWNFFSELIIW